MRSGSFSTLKVSPSATKKKGVNASQPITNKLTQPNPKCRGSVVHPGFATCRGGQPLKSMCACVRERKGGGVQECVSYRCVDPDVRIDDWPAVEDGTLFLCYVRLCESDSNIAVSRCCSEHATQQPQAHAQPRIPKQKTSKRGCPAPRGSTVPRAEEDGMQRERD